MADDFSGEDGVLLPRPVLTDRQLACLTYLYRYWREHGIYPTHREIADAMGVRSSSAETYLEPLEKKGVLKRDGRGRRNVRVTFRGLRVLEDAGVATPQVTS